MCWGAIIIVKLRSKVRVPDCGLSETGRGAVIPYTYRDLASCYIAFNTPWYVLGHVTDGTLDIKGLTVSKKRDGRDVNPVTKTSV